MSYGRALTAKAGQSGSTISDVVWMGDVVNRAAYLASSEARGIPVTFRDFRNDTKAWIRYVNVTSHSL